MTADFLITAMLAYFITFQPMKDYMNNAVQMFNEVAILLLLHFMFMFTDFNADPVDRHLYGYCFLYYVAALIAFNVLFLAVSLTRDVRRNILRCYN